MNSGQDLPGRRLEVQHGPRGLFEVVGSTVVPSAPGAMGEGYTASHQAGLLAFSSPHSQRANRLTDSIVCSCVSQSQSHKVQNSKSINLFTYFVHDSMTVHMFPLCTGEDLGL